MLGNFQYSTPTKIYFGEKALSYLSRELGNYGPHVLLVYGGGSIKKNGIYDEIISILQAGGKTVFEVPGVMPNPTLEKVLEGRDIARANQADLILAVGGGSVCDYAKALSVSVHGADDFWGTYYERMERVTTPVVPVGCILTMVGTGSEMNGGSVITNQETKQKIARVFSDNVFPRFALMNPTYSYTLPRYQMVAGCYDTLSHLLEQYLCGTDDNTSDYVSEGFMRSVIHSSLVALDDPKNYEARSNLMWTASWAMNPFISRGKRSNWMVHMIGQAVGAYTNATHGMTLSAVTMPYYRRLLPHGVEKFRRLAVHVWGVDPTGKDDMIIAKEGLDCMEAFMRKLGVVMNLKDLGVTEEMIPGIADATILMPGGYLEMNREQVIEILQESMI